MTNYAHHICDYFDTIQESFNVRLPDGTRDWLNKYQGYQKQDTSGTYGDVYLSFGGEMVTIWKGGSKGGNTWVLENDCFQFHIRETEQWAISVRYLAAGIWQYGHEEVRRRAREAITKVAKPLSSDFIRLSRVDYAIDFYSPAFSVECLSLLVAENMCLTSGVKAGLVFTSQSVETLTIGVSKNSTLQIQVYNKSQQIKDKPEAAWIKEVWQECGLHPVGEPRDVWRIETRLKKDYLKDRGIETFEEFIGQAEKLLKEALERRKMVVPTGTEKKKDRWDMHPFWEAAIGIAGNVNGYVPRGKKLVGTRKERIETLDKQLMGIMRSRSVLKAMTWEKETSQDDMRTLINNVSLDPDHAKKEREALFRYQFIDEAQ